MKKKWIGWRNAGIITDCGCLCACGDEVQAYGIMVEQAKKAMQTFELPK